MSSIYIQEPLTRGKVVLHTTKGDVDIELWTKEAPKTCRNFIQLCLEGFYDNTIFHRLIPGFIIQGGDPTGTGEGGESIYDEPMQPEIHSRLRFVRRGLVASADNLSQFFITLDKTEELQGKHTIFGKIVGDTLFNVMEMANQEVDDNDRPMYPPKILSTEILLNPFDDIIPRITAAEKRAQELARQTAAEEQKKKEMKKKAKKNVKLLSFGDEAEQEEKLLSNEKSKIRSSHDVLENDARLSKQVAVDVEKLSEAEKIDNANQAKERVREAAERQMREGEEASDEDVHDFDRKMREKLKRKAHRKEDKRDDQSESKRRKETNANHDVKSEIESLKRDLMSKRDTEDSELRNSEKMERSKKEKKLSYVEQERLKYAAGKKEKKEGIDVLAQLESFKAKMTSGSSSRSKSERKTPSSSSTSSNAKTCFLHGVPNCLSCFDSFGQEDAATDEGWLTHTLVFEKDYKGKDLMKKRDDVNDFVVIDPRERKEQAMEVERQKKMEREKSGKGISKVFKPGGGSGNWNKGRDSDRGRNDEVRRDRDRKRW
ncbi:cyclophilin-like domain-containing protein [Paraphysoderma sedebokerense]|nr:cyclophilin-like domain-containing protein [Paraphysoderma sedebokerense]